MNGVKSLVASATTAIIAAGISVKRMNAVAEGWRYRDDHHRGRGRGVTNIITKPPVE